MLSATGLGGHTAHFVVFGIPVAALVGTVAWQEVRGRLRERAGEHAADGASPHIRERQRDLPTEGLRVAAVGLMVAAAIHAAVITEHFREWVVFGLFFTALTIAQCWLAVVLLRQPERRIVRYVAIASAWVVVLWAVSRTTGIPVGPEQWKPESFGALDIAASCAELVTFIGCMTHLWVVGDHRHPAVGRRPELLR